MKNKILSFMMAAAVLMGMMAFPAFAEEYSNIDILPNYVKLNIDGIDVEAANFVYEGTTFIPLRQISEVLDKIVNYDEETLTVSINDNLYGGEWENNDYSVEYSDMIELGAEANVAALENSVKINVNDEELGYLNFVYNGRTYVPLRMVSERLGKSVAWDEETRMVSITSPETENLNRVAAVVNGFDVTVSMIKLEMNNLAYYVAEDEILDAAMANIKQMMLLAGRAIDAGFSQKEADDYAYNSLKPTIDEMGIAEVLVQMSASELTYDCIIRETSLRYLINQYIVSDSPSNDGLFPNDEDAQKYFEENYEKFEKSTVSAKHILFKTVDDINQPLEQKEIDKKKNLADEVYSKLVKGADFDEMMEKYNEDPGATKEGYTFGKGQMVKPFEDAAFSQKEGEVGKPVETVYGYHIILVTKAPSETVLADVREDVNMDYLSTNLSELSKDIPVQIVEDVYNSINL